MEKRLNASLVFVGIGIAVSGAEKHKSNSTIIQSLVHDASEIQKHVGDDIGNTTDVTDVAAKELLNSDKKKEGCKKRSLHSGSPLLLRTLRDTRFPTFLRCCHHNRIVA